MRLLWTAPAPPSLWRSVHSVLQSSEIPWNVSKDEAWIESDLRADPRVRAWVCNPSAAFVITAKTLLLFPNLNLLVTPSTGTNHLNRAEIEAQGITVKCLLDDRPALEEISASSEFTLLLLLAAMRRLSEGMAQVASGRWHDDNAVRGNEIQGKNVGLVGYGRIGRRMHRYLNALGANVAWYDPYCTNPGGENSLEFLFDVCNAVVICCTYTPQTHGMITGSLIERMQRFGVVVNTSRGEVLDEPSVLAALDKRSDIRVAVDVLAGETTGTQNAQAWLDAGVLVTPHMAGTTLESQTKAARIALQFVKEYNYQ